MAHFEKWDRGFGIPRQVRECMSALVMRVLPLVLLIMQPCSLSTLATLSNSPEGRSTRVLARSCACSLRCRGGQDKNAGAGGGAARQEVNGKEGMGRALLERYLTDAAEAERNSESFLGSSMYSCEGTRGESVPASLAAIGVSRTGWPISKPLPPHLVFQPSAPRLLGMRGWMLDIFRRSFLSLVRALHSVSRRYLAAREEQLAADETHRGVPLPPGVLPRAKACEVSFITASGPTRLGAAHGGAGERAGLLARPGAAAAEMLWIAAGRGYNRRTAPPEARQPERRAAVTNLVEESGADGASDAWLLPDGQGGDCTLDLGALRNVKWLAVTNTRGGRAGDRGTRGFRVEVSLDGRAWRTRARGELRDPRGDDSPSAGFAAAQPPPLPQVLCLDARVRLPRDRHAAASRRVLGSSRARAQVRFVRFVVVSWWGRGGGLNALRALEPEPPSAVKGEVLELCWSYPGGVAAVLLTALLGMWGPLVWLAVRAEDVWALGWHAWLL